jgi:hypothetical protein
VLDDRWMKVFTVFYLLIGIGVTVRVRERAEKAEGRQAPE